MHVILEGRGTLATSYHIMTFITYRSMIEFVAVVFAYIEGLNYSDWQYLWFDFLCLVPIYLFMGATHPSTKLTPERPQGSIINPPILINIIGSVLIGTAFMIGTYFWTMGQDFYEPCYRESDNYIPCAEQTVMIPVMVFLIAVVFIL